MTTKSKINNKIQKAFNIATILKNHNSLIPFIDIIGRFKPL
jgi:hypothetical protein